MKKEQEIQTRTQEITDSISSLPAWKAAELQLQVKPNSEREWSIDVYQNENPIVSDNHLVSLISSAADSLKTFEFIEEAIFTYGPQNSLFSKKIVVVNLKDYLRGSEVKIALDVPQLERLVTSKFQLDIPVRFVVPLSASNIKSPSICVVVPIDESFDTSDSHLQHLGFKIAELIVKTQTNVGNISVYFKKKSKLIRQMKQR